ncbi:MAG: toxin-antitoxin system YwqK family antitoxin [Bacteroidales bacterium]|nr:toxin-antitoxin system YwqK family antitoxin [Bacteroidales bacterium]
MKLNRIILLISIVLLSSPSFAQTKSLNQFDENGKKTGAWESYYESGKIKSRGFFVDGHPTGEMLRYYPGGILQASMLFDESGRISYVKMYYETGDLAAEGKYIDQVKDSVWNYYSTYDRRKAVSENMLLGKKNGVSYKYYAGNKASEYLEWKNDLKNGKWEQYYENGQVRLSGNYINGDLDGDFVSYNPDGSLSITGKYKMGQMDGTWTYYDEAGNKDLEVVYVEGKMLPNPEMDKRIEEFSKKVKDAIGNLDDVEIPSELK